MENTVWAGDECSWDISLWKFQENGLRCDLLKRFYPNASVSFFPVTRASLQEALFIKNFLPLFSNVNQQRGPCTKTHVLVDWPVEMSSWLSQLRESFPQCLSLVTQCTQKKQKYESGKKLGTGIFSQLEENPCLFLEPLDNRRLLVQKLPPEQGFVVHCLGGVEALLQWDLFERQRRQSSCFPELLLWEGSQCAQAQRGFLSWLEFHLKAPQPCVFDAPDRFLKEMTDAACQRFLNFLHLNNSENFIIICGFYFLKKMLKKLSEFENRAKFLKYTEHRVVNLRQKKQKFEKLFLTQPSKDTFVEYLAVPGFFSQDFFQESQNFDHWICFAKRSLTGAFVRCAQKYFEWTKLEISANQERDYFRFVYRLAQQNHLVFPTIFHFLLAAKAVIDGNFAYEFLQEVKKDPKNLNPFFENNLLFIDFPLQEFFKNTTSLNIEKFQTVQSRIFDRRPKAFGLSDRQNFKKNLSSQEIVCEEKYANKNWVYEKQPYFCSFPSEDLFMESLALNLKKNIQEKIKSQEIVLDELKTSFCDGIDIKETLKNWHQEKIVVKESLNVGKADIGTVVFSFARSSQDDFYSWKSFWLAEQHDNGHLMFYATPFQNNIIGPGIAKSEFGGFAVIPMFSALQNPWNHPFILRYGRNATESLLLAGALASSHKTVLFLSNFPPSQHILKVFKQSKKNIVYSKLDELPLPKLRRVRTFHILAEAGVRQYAEKYLRKE